jgi:hypothetical protein
MNIFKITQDWAQSLVNKWEEDEHKQRVEKLRSTATIFPKIKNYPPIPPVKLPLRQGEEKPKLTEPVELIIKAMKDRPETFDIEYGAWEMDLCGSKVLVKDTLTGLILRFREYYFRTDINTPIIVCVSDKWVTDEDAKAIKDQLKTIQKKKFDNESAAQKIAQEQQRLKVVEMYKGNSL